MADEHEHDDDETAAPAEISEATENRIIDRVIDAVREIVGPAGGSSDKEQGQSPPPTPAGPAATEADMERRVREEVDK